MTPARPFSAIFVERTICRAYLTRVFFFSICGTCDVWEFVSTRRELGEMHVLGSLLVYGYEWALVSPLAPNTSQADNDLLYSCNYAVPMYNVSDNTTSVLCT